MSMAPEPPSSSLRTLHVSIAKPQAQLMASNRLDLVQSLNKSALLTLIDAKQYDVCAKGIAETQM